MSAIKYVYLFGNGKAEGNAEMKDLLGGKGANLAEMDRIGIPVPPGFTITTEACIAYTKYGEAKIKELLEADVKAAMKHIEDIMQMQFGSNENPLLISVRSGARASMPGMMDTILNLGLNDNSVQGLIKKTQNERFVWDSYRRFVQMYGDVVMGLKPENKEDLDPFEVIMDSMKKERGVKNDLELTASDLKELVYLFKKAIKERTGKDFPDDPWEQLWGAIFAVFDSWNNPRAIFYRKLNNIPDDWELQLMFKLWSLVIWEIPALLVLLSPDASTGEHIFNGEYLINAQGEDVVAEFALLYRLLKLVLSAGLL